MIHDLARSGMIWRPLTESDLPALSELIIAAEHLDDTADRTDLERLRQQFHESPVDPAEHAIVGAEESSVIAYAWNQPRAVSGSGAGQERPTVVLTGAVHPARRYHQIGRALFSWQLSRALTWTGSSSRVEAYSDEHLHSRRRLYERHGLRPVRWFNDLRADLDTELRIPALPAGMRLEPFTAERSEDVRLAHYEAFAQERGSQPVTRADWVRSLERPASRPQWSWVVVDGDRVVGYALNSEAATPGRDRNIEGWTDRLGVRPQWRGQGIAQVLLRRTLLSFAEAGLDGAGLGVDAAQRRLGLYQRLGYAVTDSVVLYAKDIGPSR